MIKEIAAHETSLENRRAKIKVSIPQRGIVWYEADWRYSRGREYLGGTMQSLISDKGEPEEWISQKFAFAFDGRVMTRYTSDPRKPRVFRGHICALMPDSLVGQPTLNSLLGWGIHTSGRLSVSQALSQAASVQEHDTKEVIDGHPCVVVDAAGVGTGEMQFDVRVWIDPERDYRVLRLEHYISDPEFRWQRLYRRIDNIRLEKLNGTWIPVSGEFHSFTSLEEPEEGYTKEQVIAMGVEEGRKHVRWKLEPLMPMRLIEVAPESIVIGEEIPASEFRVTWPVGTTVWDDFVHVAYTVGKDGDKDALEAALQKRAAESTDGPDHR
jgi:hypothetical protein